MVASAKAKKIKVGFDFDGVLFYNATRNVRAYIYFVKRYFLGIKKTHFYIPKTKNTFFQKIILTLHKTSIRPNAGFDKFLALLKNPNYEVYIVTARMSFMQSNIHHLLAKYDLKGIKQIIQNQKDEQPHLYKERVIKQLGLNYYFDDNWDIVEHLAKNTQAKVIWIDNLVDSLFIKYPYKGRNLKQAFRHLK
jgi:FMN phosphatase YigB (HAD superfamily)